MLFKVDFRSRERLPDAIQVRMSIQTRRLVGGGKRGTLPCRTGLSEQGQQRRDGDHPGEPQRCDHAPEMGAHCEPAYVKVADCSTKSVDIRDVRALVSSDLRHGVVKADLKVGLYGH